MMFFANVFPPSILLTKKTFQWPVSLLFQAIKTLLPTVAIGALTQNHRGNDASHGTGGGGSFGSGGCFGAGLVCARTFCSYNNDNGVAVNANVTAIIIIILSDRVLEFIIHLQQY